MGCHAQIVGRMQAICDEFEAYGYRRVAAALLPRGVCRQRQEAASIDA